MTETVEQPIGFEYKRLENGIHHFVFHHSNKKTVEEFFRQLESILRDTPASDTARYLIDVTRNEGEVSLVTNVQRFRRLENQFPQRAKGRTVVLHRPGLAFTFIDSFIRALAPSRDMTRFFPADKRDDAIQWLLNS